jgi:Lon protease-like protein
MPLPLFPLRLLPLPGETVGLHVFEPRFQTLFNELESMQVDEFGIAFCHDQKIWRVGATMRLVTVQKRMDGGKRDVAVTSTGLFKLKSLDETLHSAPYPLGDVECMPNWAQWDLGAACTEARDALIQDMRDLEMNTTYLENQGLIRLIQHLGVDALQRAAILSQPRLEDMQRMLLERIELTRKLIQQSPQEGGGIFVN